ncbi:MAG: hypothetical protein C5S48_07435 [Candidatus Methanogaster sp.]|nr:MAG: hypothetical protein C5S48_07435 [ANME-2 cluster archaeon]
MYDAALLLEKLEQIDEALAKIERRFVSIDSSGDFLDSDCGQDMLDGIAMMLIAVGENSKRSTKRPKGSYLHTILTFTGMVSRVCVTSLHISTSLFDARGFLYPHGRPAAFA